MSFQLYDHAMKRKLETLCHNVKMAPPEKAFKRSNKSGKVELPLVSVYRISNPPNWDNYNQHETFFGRYNRRDAEQYTLTEGLPVIITYQIDIWAYEREDADGLYREIMFYFLQNPNLKIDLPTADQQLDFALQLTDVETATDYDDVDDRNMIHRYTLTYELPNARIFMEGRHPPYIKEISIGLDGDPYVLKTDKEVPDPPEENHHDPYSEDRDPINKVKPWNFYPHPLGGEEDENY